MRVVIIGGLLAALSAPAFAQQAPAASPAMAQALALVTSSTDVAALIAKAKKERKPDQANYGQSILKYGTYNVGLEYRAVVGPASVHEQEAELFYVIDGSATLVTGGTLVKENRTNPSNLSGTAIEGGQSRKIAKGDFVMIPKGTSHWISAIDGAVVLMSLHLPDGAK